MRNGSQELVDEFEACYQDLADHPDNPDTWERLGDILQELDMGSDDEALASIAAIAPELNQETCWRRVVEYDPARTRVWVKISELYLLTDEYKLALFPLRQITGRDPDDVIALCQMGMCFKGLADQAADQRDWEEHDDLIKEAEEVFQKAMEVDEEVARSNEADLMLEEIDDIKKMRLEMGRDTEP
jgi:tetratricopeptide (TPR) repeat protein